MTIVLPDLAGSLRFAVLLCAPDPQCRADEVGHGQPQSHRAHGPPPGWIDDDRDAIVGEGFDNPSAAQVGSRLVWVSDSTYLPGASGVVLAGESDRRRVLSSRSNDQRHVAGSRPHPPRQLAHVSDLAPAVERQLFASPLGDL